MIMIDELIELSGFIEQFDSVFGVPRRAELDMLEDRKLFLEPQEAQRRDQLIRELDFIKSFMVSIKTMQEYCVVDKLILDEFREGVEKFRLRSPDGGFRKSLLQPQIEFMTEIINKL